MVNHQQFRKLIIQPVLNALCHYSKEAEELLVFTMATESNGGTYLYQFPNGPALGPYQQEPRDHDDIWTNYLPYQTKLTHDLMTICGLSMKPNAPRLGWDLYYSTAMARIHYLRNNKPIPTDVEGMADYYKTYWNSALGKAVQSNAVSKYLTYIGGGPNEKASGEEGRNSQKVSEGKGKGI